MMVRLSETAQTLVALVLVGPDNRLLVVKTPSGQLELPGLELGDPSAMAARPIQFMSRLSLNQMARQTLCPPGLKMRKQ